MHKTLYNISRGKCSLAHTCGHPWVYGQTGTLHNLGRPHNYRSSWNQSATPSCTLQS